MEIKIKIKMKTKRRKEKVVLELSSRGGSRTAVRLDDREGILLMRLSAG